MNTELFHRACDLWVAAAGLQDSARAEFLERGCAGDQELRDAVARIGRGEELGESTGADQSVLPAQLPPASIGGYRIVREIGRSPLGTAFEAVEESTGRTVVLQSLRRELLRPGAELRWRELEEHAARRRDDELGLHVCLAGRDEWKPCLVTEWFDGKPITEYARMRGLSVPDRVRLWLRVAKAIARAHRAGLFHHALRPTNLLVDDTGQLRILDLGVMQLLDHDFYLSLLETGAAQVDLGIAYLAPEQVAPIPQAIDERTDVYALSVLGWVLLSGSPPYTFRGDRASDHFRVIQNQAPEILAPVDDFTRALLQSPFLQALAKNPQQRPALSTLVAEVERSLSQEPKAGEGRSRSRGNATLRWSLALVASTAVLTLAGFWFREHDQRVQNDRRWTALALEKDQGRQELERQLEKAQTALEQERRALQQTRGERDAANTVALQLEDQRSVSSAEIESLRQRLESDARNQSELAATNAGLEQAMEEARRTLEEKQAQWAAQEERDLGARIEIERRLEERDQALAAAERLRTEQDQVLARMQEVAVESAEELERSRQRADHSASTLTAERDQAREHTRTLETENRSIETERQTLAARLEQSMKDLEFLTATKKQRESADEALRELTVVAAKDWSKLSPDFLVRGAEALLGMQAPSSDWFIGVLLESAALAQSRTQLDEADTLLTSGVTHARSRPHPSPLLFAALTQLANLHTLRQAADASELQNEAKALREVLNEGQQR